MKYDFTTFLSRVGHDAIAYDGLGLDGFPKRPDDAYSPISMWVADMNFVCYPGITEGIKARLEYPSFGYFMIPSKYYQAIAWWHYNQFGVKGLKQEHLLYVGGVLGGVVAVLKTFLKEGACVLTHSPTYIGFIHAVKDAGYKLITTPLTIENGKYQMDLADMEAKIIAHDIKVMILCNPHNPSGKAWEKEELASICELCKKHEVIIISDEIWADINLNGKKHIPTSSVSSDARMRTISLYAPTKTFNLASLTGAYMVIYNPVFKKMINEYLECTCLNSPHLLSVYALINAYTVGGAEWVGELNSVLSNNVTLLDEFLKGYPELKYLMPEATYMFYIDFSKYCEVHNISFQSLLDKGQEVGVIWQDGRPFGWNQAIRINVASPTKELEVAIKRLKELVLIDHD